MFGVDTSELLIVAVLALIFIGPKELPTVMLKLGRVIGKVRGYSRHFTAGIENAIREAELEEMDRKWREQNERILAAHPADGVYPDPQAPVMTPLPVPAPGEPVDIPSPAGEDLYDPPLPTTFEAAPSNPRPAGSIDEPTLPFEAPAAPDNDPRPVGQRPLP